MKRVKIVMLIGLAALGAVYAGTRPEELKTTEQQQDLVAIMPKLKELEDMSKQEQNKLLVKVALGAISTGDWDTLGKLYSPRFVQHGPGQSKPTTWTDFELGCRVVRQKLPTLQYEIEDIIAEGDKVAVRLKAIVTYKERDFRGKTTNGQTEFTEMDLFRIEGGRIAEEWCEHDTADWKTKLRMLSLVKTWK